MTDHLKTNNLKEIYLLLVDGLPALDPKEKAIWREDFDVMTEKECVDMIAALFKQTQKYFDEVKGRDDFMSKSENRETLKAMELQAKTLLDDINSRLIGLKMKPLSN